MFFDVKKGIILEKYQKKCTDKVSVSWLSKKYNLKNEQIQDLEPVTGYGDEVIKHFLDSDALQHEFIKHMDSEYWEQHFEKWLEDILWLSSSKKRERLS